MTLQISDRVRTLAAQAEVEIKEQFAHIDAVAEHNTQRVLAAFQSNRVAESYFAGTTGYGYDDLGRDKLDQIYAELFGTEDALVRIGLCQWHPCHCRRPIRRAAAGRCVGIRRGSAL